MILPDYSIPVDGRSPWYDSLVVIGVSVRMRKALCAEAADAVDETRIKNKIRAVDDNVIEYNVFLIFILSLLLIFH